MTKQRALIYDVIHTAEDHLSAEEVLARARARMPSVARATVYNNLNALTEQGMIRRIKLYNEPDRYDRILYPHEHLICDRCGALADISLGDLREELRRRTGLEVTGYELNLHYICPNCRAAMSGKNRQSDTD